MRRILLFILLLIEINAFGQSVKTQNGTLEFVPLTDNSVRILLKPEGFKQREDIVYLNQTSKAKFKIQEDENNYTLILKNLKVVYNKKDNFIEYFDANNNSILKENPNKKNLKESSIHGEKTYEISQEFFSPQNEYLFGLGQYQDGYLNLKGLKRRLTQVNTQIAIPFIISNYNYGIIWNNYGLTEFNQASNSAKLIKQEDNVTTEIVNATSTSGNKVENRQINNFVATINLKEDGMYSFLLDCGQKMARKYQISIDGKKIIDFNNVWLPPTTSFMLEMQKGEHQVVIEGEKNDNPTLYFDKVENKSSFYSPVADCLDYTIIADKPENIIATYRTLTGNYPLLPIWALGYIHCRERYDTQKELLENSFEFKQRNIPIDVIVQDWQYWGKNGWNAMVFDQDKYPDVKEMMDSLHNNNMRLMLSVWSKIDRNSALGKEFASKNYYIPNSEWVDFFNPEAANYYWENYSNKLLKPYAIDSWWQDATEPENDDLVNRKIFDGKELGERYRNVFPMYVNKTVYQGLRKDDPNRRQLILTRSGFLGQQRYATATWSGDVGHDFATLKRQITGGLNQIASGLAWWTYDAGGFFRPWDQYQNKEFHQEFLRWLEVATFLPMMRVHGYMSQTEPWRYGEEVLRIFNQNVELRYQLFPYLYSQNYQTSFFGKSISKPLIIDFPEDENALKENYQFMCGDALLICPVVEKDIKNQKVYLPKHQSDWVDFYSNKHYPSGSYQNIELSLENIPVFVKSGSIIAMAKDKKFASDKQENCLEIRIYPGNDCKFVLYEDQGDNYKYENGEFSTIEFAWNQNSNSLTIGKRNGQFENMLQNRKFVINLLGNKKEIDYNGKKITIKF